MTFAETFKRHADLRAEFEAVKTKLQADFEAALTEAFKTDHPRAKKIPERHKLTERYPTILEHWQAVANESVEKYQPEIAALDQALNALAQAATPSREGEWRKLRSTDAGTYRTVGLGAAHYARQYAELLVDFARRLVEAKVEASSAFLEDFAVMVKTDEIGLEILRRKTSHWTLREWLAGCWKRGINPRVLNPYLPPGLEEELGVTYFGELVETK